MPLPPDLEQVIQEFREFRALIVQAQASTPEAHLQQRLQELTAQMDRGFADLLETYPKAVAELDRQQADIEAGMARTQQEIDSLKAKLAQPEAEPAPAVVAPPPPAPLPDEEPAFGLLLRNELLQRYRPRTAAERQPSPRPRDIWDYLEGFHHK
jgi:hypothetical protein